jgi:hypothetical protein
MESTRGHPDQYHGSLTTAHSFSVAGDGDDVDRREGKNR